ncbi:MAG: DUF896 domain-containing protein [Candidatus Paralactobacillus gallistercoris]|uniref:UPF0291 protein H9901_03455 n=1 Tax=Candidatus Paralactobacillus gallistercoris TaxID=2838724 RepID=A0A948TJL9_9LACO|nr:DUF896 domain-containing protein [Candidatus Paralactobacillus gallistercoris]
MTKEQDERIKRINFLANKAKNEGLTEDEKAEQKELRAAYLKDFREGFRQQIENLRIFDKEGNEVTSEKVKEIQRKKGLRND